MSDELIHRRAYAIELGKTVDFLTHRIEKVYTVMGMKIPGRAELDLLVKEIALDIRKRYSQLALIEIAEALELGSRGEYTEGQNYPSIAAFNKWLKAYKESGKHDEYVAGRREETRLMLPEKTEPTDGEKLQSSINHCLQCFETYRQTGKIFDYGNPAFNFLYQNRFLKLKQGEKELFIEDARTEMLRELSSRSIIGLAEKKDVERAMESLTSGNEDSEALVKSRAKNNLLMRYFDELLNAEIELNKILNQ